jgi:hypothetical protein
MGDLTNYLDITNRTDSSSMLLVPHRSNRQNEGIKVVFGEFGVRTEVGFGCGVAVTPFVS